MKTTFLKLSAIGIIAATMAGCMGTRALSDNISDEGTVEKDNIVFPELDKAWQKEGQFPNSENLSKIRAGIAKDELYQLIGRPHFSEANRAREWDYIMKFYRPDESVEICQYKIIFDKEFKGQEFYWKPAECINYVKPLTPITDSAPPVIAGTPIINEKVTLEADTLFYFDKHQTKDMLPQGKAKLDELIQKLRQYGQQGNMQVLITGHTDHFGNDVYNQNLSLLRAQTVRAYLINRGINADHIWAKGVGESQPIKSCATNLPRKQAIDCLQPNRRVEVQVSVYNN